MKQPNQPLVSVIVTTKNSSEFLDACLSSIVKQAYKNIELIIVDNFSDDNTKKISKQYTRYFYTKGPERSVQRNYGVNKANGDHILIIDSDMELTSDVVTSCVNACVNDMSVEAVIIPERSFGIGFWAQCKVLERSFYVGNNSIEAARFFTKKLYEQLHGFDESMVSGEDWDLSSRARKMTKMVHINKYILHNEGRLKLIKTLRKKYYYAGLAKEYLQKNNVDSKLMHASGPFERYKLFLSQPKKLFRNPIYGIGMLFMKTVEFTAGFIGLVRAGNRNDEEVSKVLLLSRPFKNSNDGTGEQVVAREIADILTNDLHIPFDYVKRWAIPPYQHIFSLLFYDYIVTFLYTVYNFIFPYKLVIFNSPYQGIFVKLFNVRGTKTVCVVHDLFYVDNNDKSLFDKYSVCLYSLCINYCSKVVTTTLENKIKIKKICEREISVSPLGTSYETSIKQLTDKKVNNRIGYIGSYVQRKRPEYLIELAHTDSDHLFEYIFAGNTTAMFLKLIEPISHNRKIRCVGELDELQKIEFFNEISFLYFPTILEGFGLPLIEAMRLGAIPVVRNDAQIPEIVKSHCFVIHDTIDAVDIFNHYILNPKKYRETILNNYNYSLQFNWKRFVKELCKETRIASSSLIVACIMIVMISACSRNY
jgi:glycosyltransferase involved in cell wall biosynthesis